MIIHLLVRKQHFFGGRLFTQFFGNSYIGIIIIVSKVSSVFLVLKTNTSLQINLIITGICYSYPISGFIIAMFGIISAQQKPKSFSRGFETQITLIAQSICMIRKSSIYLKAIGSNIFFRVKIQHTSQGITTIKKRGRT